MALSFVASNISNIDSLLGFPDEVGRQLFEEAHLRGHFRHPPSCVEPFRLFAEAYGPIFISTLKLTKIVVSSSVCEIITKSCASVLEEVHLKGARGFGNLDYPKSVWVMRTSPFSIHERIGQQSYYRSYRWRRL